jgi:hypothetical protein
MPLAMKLLRVGATVVTFFSSNPDLAPNRRALGHLACQGPRCTASTKKECSKNDQPTKRLIDQENLHLSTGLHPCICG